MYELSDYEGKSERVRMAMLLDDIEENAPRIAAQVVDDFTDSCHFCNMTRIELDDLSSDVSERGLALTDSLNGEIQGIFNRYLKTALADAGFEDISEVKHKGEYWFRFYRY